MLFSLAHWEKDGELYDRASVRAFRWILLQSPLGWINPNVHLKGSRADCDRLLRELNSSEGVHWLTCIVSVVLAIVRIPFDMYPVMLQRWHRGRVWRVLRRSQPPTTG